MKHALVALLLSLLSSAPTALAKCAPVQCSAVQLRVTSCSTAKLTAAGTLVLTLGEPVSSRSGEVEGLVLSGEDLREDATPCYKGLPADHGAPDTQGSRFFYSTTPKSCSRLVGRTVLGETEHPCCDLEPLPGEVHPGTCNPKVRLIRNVRVQ